MSSRLDRLLQLLDNGSSPTIRTAAAKQIGQIAAKCITPDLALEHSDISINPSLDVKPVLPDVDRSKEWSEVMSVVARLLPYFRSRNMETRTAAATALQHICQLVPAWTPAQPVSPDTPPSSPPEYPHFSVQSLLESGNLLLSSSGQEFTKSMTLGTPEEIARSRKEAMSRLGLDFLNDDDNDDWGKELVEEAVDVAMADDEQQRSAQSDDHEMQTEAPVDSATAKSDEESSGMSAEPTSAPAAACLSQRPPFAAPHDHVSPVPLQSPAEPDAVHIEDADAAGLSARERNRLKRKRKGTIGPYMNAPPSAPPTKMRIMEQDGAPKPTPVVNNGSISEEENKIAIDPQKGGQVDIKEKASQQAIEVKEGHWVWEGVVRVLEVDLFNANWEVRHGAALALREVIRVQGAAGGVQKKATPEENAFLHSKWTNHLAVKLLCIFVLDRFSDFVSDQVIAPVREAASQTLAALLLHMATTSITFVHNNLLQMIRQEFPTSANGVESNGGKSKKAHVYAWQVRHAGLLGLKYEVAVRSDLIENEESLDVLPGVVDAAVLGLSDADDDVRSVAAQCLIPIAHILVERLEADLPRVLAVLWGSLESITDDLGSSVGAIMELLGKLVAFPKVTDLLADESKSRPMTELAPILFPFFRHTITSVRLAVVRTLHDFISIPALRKDWVHTTFLRLIFQNLLLEEREDIRGVSLATWRKALETVMPNSSAIDSVADIHVVRAWFESCTTPLGQPLDMGHLIIIGPRDSSEVHSVDKFMITQDVALDRQVVWKARLATAQAIGILLSMWPTQHLVTYFDLPLKHYLKSISAFHQSMGAIIVQEWGYEYEKEHPGEDLVAVSTFANELRQISIDSLSVDPPACYHEAYNALVTISTISHGYIQGYLRDSRFASAGLTDPQIPTQVGTHITPGLFDISHAKTGVDWLDGLHSVLNSAAGTKIKNKRKEATKIDDAKKALRGYIADFEETQERQILQVQAAFAGVTIALKGVPPKLTPLVRGVMNSIKGETNPDLRQRSATALASFVRFATSRASVPSVLNAIEKIIKNLSYFLCQDPTETPLFDKSLKNKFLSFSASIARTATSAKMASKDESLCESKEIASQRTMRSGSVAAFGALSAKFGEELFDSVPKLWESVTHGLLAIYPCNEMGTVDVAAGDAMASETPELGQAALDTLASLREMLPTLHPSLRRRFDEQFLKSLTAALGSEFSVIRQAAAKCFAVFCKVEIERGMLFAIKNLVRYHHNESQYVRLGGVEFTFHCMNIMQAKMLPYVVFFVVPLLSSMSEYNEDCRLAATNAFATIVKMVPLEAGLPDPPNFPQELIDERETERAFLSQLLDGSKVEPYKIPVTINAELRKYQQDGVNWLYFLAKYQLHGILCDDMGLGKTLQSICILSSIHHERSKSNLPSLIVCPPTLTNHWYHEIKKFANNLRPLMYTGNVKERRAKLKKFTKFNVLITSYDVLRNDIGDLTGAAKQFIYCILDEGHIIKNGKTKVSQAVKRIKADHRLLLSGTPIQNNLLELWSLFDFLMPGFLGSEQSFNERFAKPVLASKEGKGGMKAAEAAAFALQALHKQVLPFLLRRLKENVLHDLPPKIIQDYYCDISPLQQALFDEFQKSAAAQTIEGDVQDGKEKGHVFQALQYLRKVSNHPALVLKDGKPETEALLRLNKEDESTSVRDVQHAPKLLALRQLLNDCGIGVDVKEETDADGMPGAAPPQHRCLIFCQMKLMLDVIENDLFRQRMPSVTYMRLDGSVDANKRHAIVQTFNGDPSIDCLLLTTHVGGLGLTLTGADTVIFVEHDWNPMKDLQAMDRAHRLGQTKVVNVYRLITKGTLEEKIMGSQRFKLNIAHSVVTQQNAGLDTMDTNLVLDLFRHTTEEEEAATSERKKKDSDRPVSQKELLAGLDDLPAEDEYQGLDLSSFLGSIGR